MHLSVQRAGQLQSHVHLKLEEDLRDLNLFLADNQRLFHSPIPPTMSRHVTRCLLLWLATLPIALLGRLPPIGIAMATAITTYIVTCLSPGHACAGPPACSRTALPCEMCDCTHFCYAPPLWEPLWRSEM